MHFTPKDRFKKLAPLDWGGLAYHCETSLYFCRQGSIGRVMERPCNRKLVKLLTPRLGDELSPKVDKNNNDVNCTWDKTRHLLIPVELRITLLGKGLFEGDLPQGYTE